MFRLTGAATGQRYAVLEVPGADYFVHIAFSPDGRLVLASEFYGRTEVRMCAGAAKTWV